MRDADRLMIRGNRQSIQQGRRLVRVARPLSKYNFGVGPQVSSKDGFIERPIDCECLLESVWEHMV